MANHPYSMHKVSVNFYFILVGIDGKIPQKIVREKLHTSQLSSDQDTLREMSNINHNKSTEQLINICISGGGNGLTGKYVTRGSPLSKSPRLLGSPKPQSISPTNLHIGGGLINSVSEYYQSTSKNKGSSICIQPFNIKYHQSNTSTNPQS